MASMRVVLTEFASSRSLCMVSSKQLVSGTSSCTLLSLRWDSSELKLIDLSISTQMAMSGSLSPSTLMTLPLLAKMELPLIERVKQLATHFKCRDLGATEFLLGVGITRDRKTRSIALHQRQFILDILERYNMSDCSPVLTPMSPGLVLTKEMGASSPEDVAYMKDVPLPFLHWFLAVSCLHDPQ